MMRKKYTNEVENIAIASMPNSDIESLLEYEIKGPFWDLLEEQNITLAVSREYEHFIALLSTANGTPVISNLEIPHPSGMFYDQKTGDLLVSSTRTPNQIFWLKALQESDYGSDIVPTDFKIPKNTVFIPYRSLILPGTLYIHDLVMMGSDLFATITGHNFLAQLYPDGGWKRVWWPALLDGMGRSAFDQNYLQLNSIAVGSTPENSFYTAFSDETSGTKPWKTGYGPRERGVIFDGLSRQVLLRGLTCPHSAKKNQDHLWLCNSGYGQVGKVDIKSTHPNLDVVAEVDGFTRGMAFSGQYAFIGLSKVIDFYEPYAPGLSASKSKCGITILDVLSGEIVASLDWPRGYQIYDVQVMPGVQNAIFPHQPMNGQGINEMLRYLG